MTRLSLASLTLAAFALLLSACEAQLTNVPDIEGLADCWGFEGHPYPNNTVCPNSRTCCNGKATCTSNRLCHNDGDPEDVWIRGSCYDWDEENGWNMDTCAQICLGYNEIKENGGRLPRVTACNDGSLCCFEQDPDCCLEGRGVFLDASGRLVDQLDTNPVISYPPRPNGQGRSTSLPFISTTSSTRVTSTSTTSTTDQSQSATSEPETSPTDETSNTNTEPSPTDTPTADSSTSDNSIGLKVGLGLGIPLAALLSGLAAYCFFKKRNAGAAADPSSEDGGMGFAEQQQLPPYHEAPALPPKEQYYHGHQELPVQPAELSSNRIDVVEMDAGQHPRY